MTRVLVVDDSPTVRDLLVFILGSDPEIEIVGCAFDGDQALRMTQEKRPDVITMDLHMPNMDGFEATRRIMEACPTPIVIVSGSSSKDDVNASFRAVEAGALVIVHRPPGPGNSLHHQAASALIRTVKSMAEVKVVRRWPKDIRQAPVPSPGPVDAASAPAHKLRQLVVIGASTGGPAVIAEILTQLPASGYRLPVVIVQHMTAGFAPGFADWLTSASGFRVGMAQHGDFLASGRGYLAPDGYQIAVNRELRIALSRAGSEHGMCPSVSHLFRSIPLPLRGATIAVLLTGMGKDGALELRELRNSGAMTIVQDRATSAVYGMPGEAIKHEAACMILPPAEIGNTLRALGQRPASDPPVSG